MKAENLAYQPEEYLKKLYANRFNYEQQKAKLKLWKVLIKEFLQKYIRPDSDVLDIGGGYCEFINNIQGKNKYLIDLNPDAKDLADSNVTVLNINVFNLTDQNQITQKFDHIFISNFFEHLKNKEELITLLAFVFSLLKKGGSLLIIQPNFKYSYREYYDFIDHELPITHLSLQELLETIGYKIDVMIPRFLPFSTKGRPSSPILLKIYLKIPFFWQILGGQMFIKASKP